MALGSRLITVRRLDKYIGDVIGKKANLPDTSKTIIGNISQINSDLTANTHTYYNPQQTTIPLNTNFTCPASGIVIIGGYDNVSAKFSLNGLEIVNAIFPTISQGGAYQNTRQFIRVLKNDTVFIACDDASKLTEHLLNPIK